MAGQFQSWDIYTAGGLSYMAGHSMDAATPSRDELGVY